ncbi:hypothetical protein GCM10007939_09230 [Amylibacter marinus]|uniref:Uncharacterized protein n=1 Tax=Amylibacter marinus TaxID=1475483 RepID=A0ABQ5VT85_9RHOB|nr:hypothetical protein GCM10007939_09230 [Amylibacter marinus]
MGLRARGKGRLTALLFKATYIHFTLGFIYALIGAFELLLQWNLLGKVGGPAKSCR